MTRLSWLLSLLGANAVAILLNGGAANAIQFTDILLEFTACDSALGTGCPANQQMHGLFSGDTVAGTATFEVTSGGFPVPGGFAGDIEIGTTYQFDNFVASGGEFFFTFLYQPSPPRDFNSIGLTPTANPNEFTARFCYAGSNPTPSSGQCSNSNNSIQSVEYSGTSAFVIPHPMSAFAILPLTGLALLRKRYNFS